MKSEKDLPYVLEDEFRGPNDLGISREFGEDDDMETPYHKLISSTNELYITLTGNFLVENADEEYFIIRNGMWNDFTKIARIKYTKPEYVHLPKEFDCGKEELILTKEEKQILNDFFKKDYYNESTWKHFLRNTKEELEYFYESYITEDIEQPNYLELPDERKD